MSKILRGNAEKAAAEKRRFVVKPLKHGRNTVYGVYDTHRAAFPAITHELGKVVQDHPTEEAAQAEADRLEEKAR